MTRRTTGYLFTVNPKGFDEKENGVIPSWQYEDRCVKRQNTARIVTIGTHSAGGIEHWIHVHNYLEEGPLDYGTYVYSNNGKHNLFVNSEEYIDRPSALVRLRVIPDERGNVSLSLNRQEEFFCPNRGKYINEQVCPICNLPIAQFRENGGFSPVYWHPTWGAVKRFYPLLSYADPEEFGPRRLLVGFTNLIRPSNGDLVRVHEFFVHIAQGQYFRVCGLEEEFIGFDTLSTLYRWYPDDYVGFEDEFSMGRVYQYVSKLPFNKRRQMCGLE